MKSEEWRSGSALLLIMIMPVCRRETRTVITCTRLGGGRPCYKFEATANRDGRNDADAAARTSSRNVSWIPGKLGASHPRAATMIDASPAVVSMRICCYRAPSTQIDTCASRAARGSQPGHSPTWYLASF